MLLIIILLSLCACHVEMIFLNRIRVKMLNENNIIYLQHLKPLLVISDSCLKVQQAWYFSNQCMSCFEDYRNVTQRAYYSLMGWPVYSLFFFFLQLNLSKCLCSRSSRSQVRLDSEQAGLGRGLVEFQLMVVLIQHILFRLILVVQ